MVERGNDCSSSTLFDSGRCASMGPRLVERGKFLDRREEPIVDSLQWGRAWLSAESRLAGTVCAFGRIASWGRVGRARKDCTRKMAYVHRASFNGAALGLSAERREPPGNAARKISFNGAGLLSAERTRSRGPDRRRAASMGPRLVERGKASLTCRRLSLALLQWGRAWLSAGKEVITGDTTSASSELQWGRAWSSAEAQQ